MRIFRAIVIGFLIVWLTLPLPMFISPESAEQEFTDQPMVSVVLKKQKTQKSPSGFLSQIKIKAKTMRSIKAPLLIHQVMVDDLIAVEQLIQITLFYFWQGLIKPSRQLLWQMTTQMQKSLIKKMAGVYRNSRFTLYFEDVSRKIETVLDQ